MYAINLLVGDARMRVCYDRDNERIVLIPTLHVQPNESMLFETRQLAIDWYNATDYAYVGYELIPMNPLPQDEF